MSRKANPAVVGVFVVIAVALLTVAIIVFGKGQLFKETSDWVLYFDGSIKGLSTGSAVVFQGVRIGEVKDIRIQIDKKGNVSTPVIMQLDASLIDFDTEEASNNESRVNTRKMIERGLRAQLQTQSLITGQLLIQLSFQPDKEAVYRSTGGPLPEMPTVPSTVQELSKTLEKLPMEEIVNNIHSITENLNKLMNSPDLKNGLTALSDSLRKTEAIMTKIEEQITPVSNEARTLLKSTDKLINDNNDKLGALLEDLKKTSESTRTSVEKLTTNLDSITSKTDNQLGRFLETATKTTENAGRMIDTQSRFRHELNNTLEELNSALRSIRLLAEYMEQHPESIIKGKSE